MNTDLTPHWTGLPGRSNMRITRLRLSVVAIYVGMLWGCTTQEVSRNVYDGVKNHNEALKSTPPEDSSPRVPSYEEYDRERRALSKPGSQ